MIHDFIKISIISNFSFAEWIFSKNEETDNCGRDIPDLFLLNEQIIWYYSSHNICFIFLLSSTSSIVPDALYTAKKLSHSSTHVKSENQNTKRRMETKHIPYFCFSIKWCWKAKSMKKTNSMSVDGSKLSKSHFDCYFRRSLVNFKNLIILFLEHVDYAWLVKKLEVLHLIQNI